MEVPWPTWSSLSTAAVTARGRWPPWPQRCGDGRLLCRCLKRLVVRVLGCVLISPPLNELARRLKQLPRAKEPSERLGAEDRLKSRPCPH